MSFVESHSDGRSGSIPEPIQVHIELLHRQPHPFCDRFDDPKVCLVRNDTSNVFVAKTRILQNLVRSVEHASHSLFVDLFANHFDSVEALIDILFGDRATGPAARHHQDIGKRTIGSHVGRNDPVGIGTIAQDGRAGAITKKHAGITVGPISNCAEFVSTNDQDSVINMGGNELLGDLQRV